MKKRNRSRRECARNNRGGYFNALKDRAQRKRRAWLFEQLEERHLMTATPTDVGNVGQWVMISSDTPGGQELIRLLELDAAQRSSGASGGGTTAVPLALPTDPNLLEQWHLINVGQVVNYNAQASGTGLQKTFGTPGEDINVTPVWESGITGQGILIAVVDSGVELNHEDLAQNISLQYAFNAISGGTDAGPTNATATGAHGTQVAGLIGAVANNGNGGVGVAYGSTLVPIRLITGNPLPDQAFINAFNGNGAPIDIYNHSWGPSNPDNPRGVSGPSQAVLNALINSATNGRGGLGAIHVFASGNDAGPQFSEGFADIGFLDSMGSNGYANSRYVISVGAVDHDGSIFNADGTVTLYGEAGTALLVVAPTGSFPFDIASNQGTGSGIFTTDLTVGGTNLPPVNGSNLDDDLFPDAAYTSLFNGTSAAAPLVSGVIALMLEADKAANDGVATLSYRDVQEILVRSARQNSPNDGSWIVNPVPFFHDAVRHFGDELNDEIEWIVGGSPEEPEAVPAPGSEGYNPVLGPRSLSTPPPLFTNGAGYTVSHGWVGDFANEYGYGHGVIDAELAVQLASQWNLKDQSLGPEKTVVFLLSQAYKVQAFEVIEATDAPGDEIFIPGLVLSPAQPFDSFGDYFQEFYKIPTVMEGTEEGDPPTIDPDSLPFNGDDPPVNDHGSYIEVAGPQNMSVEWVELRLDIPYSDANNLDRLRITLVSPDGTHSELTHYQYPGEYAANDTQYFRYTSLYPGGTPSFLDTLDPPGELDSDLDGNSVFSWTYTTNRHWGERSDGIWQIHMENYSDEEFTLGDMQLVFHGQDVGSPGTTAQRYLGFVNDSGGYLGHGSNVTVYVKDTAGNRVAQFVTGADGNYYFDLGPGNYTLGIDVPEGYELAPGTMAEVPLTGGHVFSIVPEEPPVTTVTLSGNVWADLDGEGDRDETDVGMQNFVVYVDVNHTGQFDPGEPSTLTEADGSYEITLNIIEPTIITLGVKPPVGWQPTGPATGLQSRLASPLDDSPTGIDFGVKPPSTPSGQGNATIIGFVFSDRNGNGQRESASEPGFANLTVFIDADGDGEFDEGVETSTTTNAEGAYQFSDVGLGQKRIDVVVAEPYVMTSPAAGFILITLGAGQVASGVNFGVQNLATDDFGDLVGAGFSINGPASHFVSPGFSLGATVDAEIRPRSLVATYPNGLNQPPVYVENPALHGIGDDEDDPNSGGANIDDEDGVILLGGVLRPGVNTLSVTVNGVGGNLQGWIDFNDNGTFDANEQVFTNRHLNPGTHLLTVTAPQTLTAGQVAARFRWGAPNLGFSGPTNIGEVEDYLFPVVIPVVGDYNADGIVNRGDYQLWKSTYGSTLDRRADGNNNGVIDAGDYTVWRNNSGNGSQQQFLTGNNLALNSGTSEFGTAQLDNNGYVGTYITLAAPGNVTVSVEAWGVADDAVNPHMNIVIADTSAGFTVTPGFNKYEHTFNLPAGTYLVRTEFTNDDSSDRSVSISEFKVSGATLVNENTDANALVAADTYIENFRQGLAVVTLVGAAPGTQVDVQLKRHAFNFGANLPGTSLAQVINGRLDNPNFTDFFKEHFNMVVPSNAAKWGSQEGGDTQPATPSLDAVDAILDFAEANGMRARMHNMIWGAQQPNWVNDLLGDASFGDPTALAQLTNAINNRIDYYVADMAQRYLELDVYNESVHTGVLNFPSYWALYGADGIADIHDDVAQAVAAAAAQTKLYVNEYNILQNGFDEYGNWYREHIEEIQNADGNSLNGPIGGVGMQYYGLNGHSAAYMQQVLQNMSVTGLPLSLTEFGVQGSVTDEEVASQIVTEALRMIFGTPQAQTFMYWGFWEGARDPNLQGASELVDTNWNLTTVGTDWLALMNSWDTTETLQVAANGTISFTGFYGDYEITIGGNTYDLSLNKGQTQYSIPVGGGGGAAGFVLDEPTQATLAFAVESDSDVTEPVSKGALPAFGLSTSIGMHDSYIAGHVPSAAAAPASGSNLLLLDEALSQYAPTSTGDDVDDDAALSFASDEETQDARELALAAAFDEQADWRL